MSEGARMMTLKEQLALIQGSQPRYQDPRQGPTVTVSKDEIVISLEGCTMNTDDVIDSLTRDVASWVHRARESA